MLKRGLVIGGLAIAAVAVIGASSAFAHGPFGGGKARAAVVETASQELGLSRADLVDELRAGNSIAQVAENQGVDVNDIVAAVVDKLSDGLNQAVDDGRLTQEEADSRLGEIGERVANAMVQAPNFGKLRFGGMWRGNMGYRGLLVVAAGELDMTPGELFAELREGKSIADVAEAKDVNVDVIIGAMAEKAEERLAMFEEKVTKRINEPWTAKPTHARDGERRGRQFGPGHGRGPGMERHFGGENGDASVLTDQIEKTDL